MATDSLTVASIHSGQDTGGQSWRLKQAFDRHAPGWSFRSMAQRMTYIDYPQDLPWRKRGAEQLANESDVIHWHNGYGTARALKMTHKPSVVHYHGTMFRSDPNRYVREQRSLGGFGLVSTLDLWLLAPDDVDWLPAPYDIDWLAGMRQKRDDGKVIIAHAPTNREVKSTAQFLEAIDQLKAEGYPVELELIERASWAQCLARKSRADIFFDQTLLGYGCNALEAWGMGIPVVAGASDETLDEMERRFGHLPFYHATEETIYDALKELVESPELREQFGQIGHDYGRDYHSEQVVVEQLKDLYQRAIGSEAKAA